MQPPDRAVFRLPFSAIAFPILLFIITTPLATTLPILNILFALPVIALIYIIWTRTIADSHSIVAQTLLGRRKIAWADLDGFEFRGIKWATAVTLDGKRIKLPMVRPRDLPALAAVSGGRLSLGPQAAEVDDSELDESESDAAMADHDIDPTAPAGATENDAAATTADHPAPVEGTEIPVSHKPE